MERAGPTIRRVGAASPAAFLDCKHGLTSRLVAIVSLGTSGSLDHPCASPHGAKRAVLVGERLRPPAASREHSARAVATARQLRRPGAAAPVRPDSTLPPPRPADQAAGACARERVVADDDLARHEGVPIPVGVLIEPPTATR